MKSTTALWRIAGLSALLATLLMIVGFGYAVRTVLFPTKQESASPVPAPTPAPSIEGATGNLQQAKEIHILAVGDSLTRGLGDTTGKGGYVDRVKEGLKTKLDKDTFVWNFAISGSKTEDLLQQLEGSSQAIPEAARKANVILVSIGGNDLFQMGVTDPEAAANAGQLTLDYAAVEAQLPAAFQRLEDSLTKLSQLNPNARIVYVMFYHPFLDYDKERVGALLVQHWYAKAFEIANRLGNVTVVPTFDLFDQTPQKYLYTDHFHPNAEGYARIAERVLQAVD
ncbi:GDSL-type esterase/lipase family protein [Gorillibacterium sp. CAU 1737]|uniref:GDSL-type esterase/lipase family protein n=1 Tax=Gorillibacterium sp. CAU 1737 TaxID=3140362 RepID=UPI003260A1C6